MNSNYILGYHGTKFHCLESILHHGLKKPGSKVDGKVI